MRPNHSPTPLANVFVEVGAGNRVNEGCAQFAALSRLSRFGTGCIQEDGCRSDIPSYESVKKVWLCFTGPLKVCATPSRRNGRSPYPAALANQLFAPNTS